LRLSGPVAIDPAIGITLRAGLSLLFFWTAVHKLRDRSAFRAALRAYELVPPGRVRGFAALLIALEIAVAATLLVSEIGSAAALAGAILLATYTGAIAINLLRGRRQIACGCAGAAARQPLSLALVGRNVVLIIVALAGALPALPRALTTTDGVTIGAGVVTLAFLYSAVDGLIANHPRIAALARDRVLPGPAVGVPSAGPLPVGSLRAAKPDRLLVEAHPHA
jgi:methylamine utilization protein MauE